MPKQSKREYTKSKWKSLSASATEIQCYSSGRKENIYWDRKYMYLLALIIQSHLWGKNNNHGCKKTRSQGNCWQSTCLCKKVL